MLSTTSFVLKPSKSNQNKFLRHQDIHLRKTFTLLYFFHENNSYSMRVRCLIMLRTNNVIVMLFFYHTIFLHPFSSFLASLLPFTSFCSGTTVKSEGGEKVSHLKERREKKKITNVDVKTIKWQNRGKKFSLKRMKNPFFAKSCHCHHSTMIFSSLPCLLLLFG